MIGKILLHIEKSPIEARRCRKRFVPKTVGGSGGSTDPKEFCNVYPHLRLEKIFPALKLT